MQTTTPPRRDAVLDILKFVAIFMVVNGHAFQYSGSDTAYLDMAFMKFTTITQMPLFTFISGYVSYRSMTTLPLWRGGIMANRWYSLIRPMIIFCLIWAVIELIFYKPHPVSAYEIIDTTLFSIKSSYWFIYIVIYGVMIGYATLRWGGIRAMIVAWLVIQFIPDGMAMPPFINFLKTMIPFFFGGMLFKQYDLFNKLQSHKWITTGVALAVLATSYVLYRGTHTFYFFTNLEFGERVGYYTLMLFGGFASIIICYFVAQRIDRWFGNSSIVGIMKRLGGLTFAIYMLQGLVFAAMRQHSIHIDSKLMQLLLSISIFTALCLTVYAMSQSRLLSRLLLGKRT